ncbi:UPF0637 protein [Lentibacillus sp. JNUCC-1]|uniref:YktB family protein n=1 Tax=Lentibacillus sp. JNUCC-1 TaxID=2654513 RepID=UPI0012E8273C|nr:DUF1054 domain-containing protein [Lentibacillus sp. JNUCC-1]MUV36265.1 UPF0637 protein [Lentibacillus sp. JNUCC-1]
MVEAFTQKDFDTFKIDGLESRMEAIQQRIQPKFQEIGTELADHLSQKLGNEMYLHIAKHARRTVNPPNDTWLAVADNKRGYKKHPHFQVGLFDSHLFIWLAFIYELDGKSRIASEFLNNLSNLKQLPEDYVVSLDHMKKDAFPIDSLETSHLERFRDVKKAEFLIGRHLLRDDVRLQDNEQFMAIVMDTADDLVPFYQKAMQARSV